MNPTWDVLLADKRTVSIKAIDKYVALALAEQLYKQVAIRASKSVR